MLRIGIDDVVNVAIVVSLFTELARTYKICNPGLHRSDNIYIMKC